MVLVAFHQKNSLITGVENGFVILVPCNFCTRKYSLPLTKIVLPQKNLDQHLNDHAFFFLYFIYLFSFYRYSTNNIQIETYKHYKIYNNYLNYKKKKKKKIE